MKHEKASDDMPWFLMKKRDVEGSIQAGFDELSVIVATLAKHPTAHKRETKFIREYLKELKDTLFEYEEWLNETRGFGL